MRAVHFVVPLLLLAPFAAFASGSAGPLVDAGDSRVVEVATAFALAGHVEGASAAATVAWTADAPCTIDDPTTLATTATCPVVGRVRFTLSLTDGNAVASDHVLLSVVRTSTTELARATGTTLAGAGGAPALHNHPVRVPAGTLRATFTLSWPGDGAHADDYDMSLTSPTAASTEVATTKNPEVHAIDAPTTGWWNVKVVPSLVENGRYTLVVTGVSAEGDRALPRLQGTGARAQPGDTVTLHVAPSGGTPPYAIAWEREPTSRAFDDGTGASHTFPFTSPTLLRARVTDAIGYETTLGLPVVVASPRPVTVVAVVDNAFSPYHFDFTAAQHPWARSADPGDDLDLAADPASYIAGHPGATPLHLTLPTSPGETVSGRATGVDRAAWSGMQASTLANPKLYYIPGTKIVGAMHFGGGFVGTNDDHGSRSAASAAGNWHGSCPECLFVLVQDGGNNAGLRWAASQPWIDVVTNSYGHGGPLQTATLGVTRDNMYWMGPVNATRVASEAGQTIVFSAGNGFVNAFDVPMFTYWSSEKGPDWMVTVGAVHPAHHQTYSGAGKPADVSSIGSGYPSSGTATANGTGLHSGTSNAAPVTAGYFAKVIQAAREALGDLTAGHAGGVVASGAPVACGAALPACALGDGVLTREELEDVVYANVLPSAQVVAAGTVWPSTEYTYYYQGHGVLHGRIKGDAFYEGEWTRMADHLVGDVAGYPRPPGEANWFVVDSKCRQSLWGAWAYGDYDGAEPTLDPVADPIATPFHAWCSAVPTPPFAPLDPTR